MPKCCSLIRYWGWIGCAATLWLELDWRSLAHAQPNTDPSLPAICEVDFGLLQARNRGNRTDIVTADTLSARAMTIPSLWWTRDQFPPKLIINWIAERERQQIYLLVNDRAWNKLDYFDRYRVLSKFGRVAHDYGYNLKICSSQKILLAQYLCPAQIRPIDNSQLDPTTTQKYFQTSCEALLSPTDQTGLGVTVK